MDVCTQACNFGAVPAPPPADGVNNRLADDAAPAPSACDKLIAPPVAVPNGGLAAGSCRAGFIILCVQIARAITAAKRSIDYVGRCKQLPTEQILITEHAFRSSLRRGIAYREAAINPTVIAGTGNGEPTQLLAASATSCWNVVAGPPETVPFMSTEMPLLASNPWLPVAVGSCTQLPEVGQAVVGWAGVQSLSP